MHLLTAKVRAIHTSRSGLGSSPRFLAHESEPVDYHQKYNDDGHNNLSNFFDDLYVEEKLWVSVAKRYLKNRL